MMERRRYRPVFRPLPAQLSSGLVERDPRRALELPCKVLVGGSAEEAILETVSYRGFGLRCPTTLALGTHVLLELPVLGAVSGQVRWSFCGRAGGTFHLFLDDGQILRLQQLSAAALASAKA